MLYSALSSLLLHPDYHRRPRYLCHRGLRGDGLDSVSCCALSSRRLKQLSETHCFRLLFLTKKLDIKKAKFFDIMCLATFSPLLGTFLCFRLVSVSSAEIENLVGGLLCIIIVGQAAVFMKNFGVNPLPRNYGFEITQSYRSVLVDLFGIFELINNSINFIGVVIRECSLLFCSPRRFVTYSLLDLAVLLAGGTVLVSSRFSQSRARGDSNNRRDRADSQRNLMHGDEMVSSASPWAEEFCSLIHRVIRSLPTSFLVSCRWYQRRRVVRFACSKKNMQVPLQAQLMHGVWQVRAMSMVYQWTEDSVTRICK